MPLKCKLCQSTGHEKKWLRTATGINQQLKRSTRPGEITQKIFLLPGVQSDDGEEQTRFLRNILHHEGLYQNNTKMMPSLISRNGFKTGNWGTQAVGQAISLLCYMFAASGYNFDKRQKTFSKLHCARWRRIQDTYKNKMVKTP